jgi:hypothetical protein
MPTGLLVMTAPALSVARTVRTWLPDATFLHVKEYGAAVSWPSTVVPSRNSTFVTVPSGSLAVAVIVIVGFQAKTAPSAGEVMFAVGAVRPSPPSCGHSSTPTTRPPSIASTRSTAPTGPGVWPPRLGFSKPD